jgi:hypothetical protein
MHATPFPLTNLVVSTLNVRKALDAGQEDSNVEELATSIREKGLLSPLSHEARKPWAGRISRPNPSEPSSSRRRDAVVETAVRLTAPDSAERLHHRAHLGPRDGGGGGGGGGGGQGC